MNCKQGDIAIIVNDDFIQNIGKIVTVERIATEEEFGNMYGKFHWVCIPSKGSSLIGFNGNDDSSAYYSEEGTAFADCDLRPIREIEGEDETITWSGKPEKVTQ